MKKQIVTDNGIFEFEEEHISIANSNVITHEDAKELLFYTKELFDKIGLKFYLAFGTLLGALREKDFIKGDYDVDIFIENEKKLVDSLFYLFENGLKLVRVEKNKMYTFRLNSFCYIDVYLLLPIKGFSLWKFYCVSLNGNYTPKSFFTGYENISFLGENFDVVKNPERIIRYWYGDSWNVPLDKQHYYSHYEVFSHQLVKNPKAALKLIFRTFVGNDLYLKMKQQWRKCLITKTCKG